MTGSDDRAKRAAAFCREILPGVSRTFALGIRVLPGTLRAAVRTAYLICRIADTVEDEPVLPAAEKAALFDGLAACFESPEAADAFAARAQGMTGEAAHVRLARHTDLVFVELRGLDAPTRAHVGRWALEMIRGMRKFVLAYPHGIRIQSVEEYREYCYYVAGTVGHMLTDLWREHAPSIGPHRYEVLVSNCRAFGEALQTVNILKDVARDADHENSIYIPEELLVQHGSAHASLIAGDRAQQSRDALGALVQLAWRDLDGARAYLLAIPRRAVSIRLFCALPLVFAYATLRALVTTPHAFERREVVKISRREVRSLMVLSVLSVMSNRALSRLMSRAATKPLLLGL